MGYPFSPVPMEEPVPLFVQRIDSLAHLNFLEPLLLVSGRGGAPVFDWTKSAPGLIAMENDGSQNFIPFPAVFHGRNAASFAQTRGPSRPDMNPAWDENFAFKNGVGKKQFSGFGLENVFR